MSDQTSGVLPSTYALKCELCRRRGQPRDIVDRESNHYEIVLCGSHFGNWMAHGSKKIVAIIAKLKEAKQ